VQGPLFWSNLAQGRAARPGKTSADVSGIHRAMFGANISRKAGKTSGDVQSKHRLMF
jgi:hypothetical protein